MLEARVDRLERRTNVVESQLDRLIVISIETQTDVKMLKEFSVRTDERLEQIMQNMDGLVLIVKRHDDEIGALVAAARRITDKLETM